MRDSQKVRLIIRYTNNTSQEFEVPVRTEPQKLATRIEKLLDAKYATFELPGRLLLIQTEHILTVEVLPPPPKLPETAIRDVRFLR